MTSGTPPSMRAARLHGRGDVRIETVEVPRPAAGEVLLRVGTVGLCGTDAAEFAHGPRMMPVAERHPVTGHHGPMVLGHEFSGWVAAVGEGVDPALRGRLVASCGAMSCGSCWQCERGRTNLCVRYAAVGLHRDGAAAEFVTTPLTNCLPADAHGLGPDAAALAQPMSIAVHARRRGRAEHGERAVLLGAGGIGAFLTYALAAAGVAPVVIDPDPARRDLAVRLGAPTALPPEDAGGAAEVLGGPPHLVFEASGSAAGLGTALRMLPPGGRLVLVGLQKLPKELDLHHLTLTELELIGTNAMRRAPDFDDALTLVAGRTHGWADIAPTALPLEELVSGGLEPLAAGQPAAVKLLVDPQADRPRPTDTRPRSPAPAAPAHPPPPPDEGTP